jgi:hypothetical protein
MSAWQTSCIPISQEKTMAKASKTTAPSIHIGISDKDRAAIAQGLARLLAAPTRCT